MDTTARYVKSNLRDADKILQPYSTNTRNTLLSNSERLPALTVFNPPVLVPYNMMDLFTEVRTPPLVGNRRRRFLKFLNTKRDFCMREDIPVHLESFG